MWCCRNAQYCRACARSNQDVVKAAVVAKRILVAPERAEPTDVLVVRLMLQLLRRTGMVVGMRSHIDIIAAVSVLRGRLAGGIRMIILVSSADMVIVVPGALFRAIDVVRRSAVAACLFLPPSSIVAFVAERDSCLNALPK